MSRGFTLNETRWLFTRNFLPLLKQAVFFKAAVAALKIGLRLKPNHQNQVKLVQIPVIDFIKRQNFCLILGRCVATICVMTTFLPTQYIGHFMSIFLCCTHFIIRLNHLSLKKLQRPKGFEQNLRLPSNPPKKFLLFFQKLKL